MDEDKAPTKKDGAGGKGVGAKIDSLKKAALQGKQRAMGKTGLMKTTQDEEYESQKGSVKSSQDSTKF
eukprot:gene7997-7393_t